MEAVVDCDVLEASTPDLDDVVRLSDRYGEPARRLREVIIRSREREPAPPHARHAQTDAPGRRPSVMQFILDDLRALGTIDEVIYITGHLKERVEAYAREFFRCALCSSSRRSRTARPGPWRWRAPTWTAGSHRLRRHNLRRRPLGDRHDGRRWDHLDERGGRLPAVRRGCDGSGGVHDADRREAHDPDLPAGQHRAVLHPELAAAVRGIDQCCGARRTRASTTSRMHSST